MEKKEQFYLYTNQMAVGYRGIPLIHNMELKLEKGRIMTLIGPNGAGKSTILKSITRQLDLIDGTAFLEGKNLTKYSEKDLSKKLAIVLTQRMHTELLTCRDIVENGRYPYTGHLGILSAADREKVAEAMQLCGITEIGETDFGNISDGQRQRVLLARAICQEPDLLVLDEPTSFLDIRHKLDFLTILRNMVNEKGLTVLMSLHELDLAQKISDTIICVNGDVIERIGEPEEIFEEDYINNLFGVKKGSYHAAFGSMEFSKTAGIPEVFVIAGCGCGIPEYHRLQRKGIAFATGVLHKNDVDYCLAEQIASEVISEEAFCAIQEKTYQKALDVMLKCSQVLCPLKQFGEMNEANKRLLQEAEKRKLL